ncbi:MAG: thiamine pyrophosphate-binding protein [Deltaproteobacteria bacterium]|nr:thiamine pyrophosphate-binding protein [Deltaproteobacteria bacterium]
MNTWQAIVSALRAEKTEYLFGLPSGDLFYDALYDVPEIKTVLVREESAGPFMAMGYSRVSGKPGICYAPSGPGVAHLVPGVLEAQSACLPVIAIGCSSKRANAGMGAFQEVDQISILKSITKWCERVTEPERIFWVMRRAFSLATNGKPGPVYVDIPRDVGARETSLEKYVPAEYPLKSSGDPQRIKEAATLLLKARRPVIVAGGGAISSRAFEEVRKFAELLNLPVMTTPCGRGILSEEHSLAFGLVGLYFSKVGEKVYGESDLLMTLGSRNEDFQSGEQKFFPRGARYIQVDIDPEEIGRNWIPDVAVVGDVKLVLRALIKELQKGGVKKGKGNDRISELLKEKDGYEAKVKRECRTDSVPIKTKRVIREMYEVFGKDTILVNENGSQDLWSYYWPYYKVGQINSCVAPGEQTCMGGGCSAAIGAKLAMPDKNVVCPTGDGAFQMFMKELPTAVQHQAPVAYLILNNFSLGWIKFGQRKRGNRFISTDFKVQPDFVQVARASQCYGERVEKPEDIRPALERALKATREGIPAVLDFVVDGWDFAAGFLRFYQRLA